MRSCCEKFETRDQRLEEEIEQVGKNQSWEKI
jgi:hypothetical protein